MRGEGFEPGLEQVPEETQALSSEVTLAELLQVEDRCWALQG